MERFIKQIDDQIQANQGKNIFLENNMNELTFIDGTIKTILNIHELPADYEPVLIDYASEKAIEEFCRINQYYTFNTQSKTELREIYRELLHSLKIKRNLIKFIEKQHYSNLKKWLQKNNSFAEQIYLTEEPQITPVNCFEYSPEIQLEILKIIPESLSLPVLDIGCGKEGNLVRYLNQLSVTTKGIDRFSFSNDYLINADWLEYDYGVEKWGTIVSNLGFSNHFTHHHLRKDGNYIGYAKKYMEILNSLKPGGKFHYAPAIPFIEMHLNNKQFLVETFEIGDLKYKTTIITRL
jgi:hypothetical protein